MPACSNGRAALFTGRYPFRTHVFTALGNNNMNLNLNTPMASLPQVIYLFATGPYEDLHKLAWAGALLVTATVLTLSIIARLLEAKQRN